jgi:hypothetical protein
MILGQKPFHAFSEFVEHEVLKTVEKEKYRRWQENTKLSDKERQPHPVWIR